METKINCVFGHKLACLGGLNKVKVWDRWIQKQIHYKGIHPQSSTNMMPNTTLIVLSYRGKATTKSCPIPLGEISYMNHMTPFDSVKDKLFRDIMLSS